jgi:hypothetical protein
MMILKTSRSNLSSNDQLSLDLPFAATKSLAARVGPTPTFTRGSGATYIGSDGLIHGVDTSTTSNTIGTGSRTFTLAATAGQDQFWRTGDAVEASNGSNIMAGTVTSYDATTQSLVCNMTTASGTGTFTSWRIGYRGPRFDHNPTSPFACRGLLIEEGRTNLYQQSEVFNNSFWSKTRSSIREDETTAPDGTLTADKLVEDTTASNTHTIQSTVTPPATAHTLSVFAKKGERTWIVLRLGGTNTFFNLDDGTIAAGSVNSPTITNFGNGWYRCAVTSSLGTQGQFWLATNSTTTSYTGDGTSGLFIWGAQLEAGSFPTSYIPTTTGTLARGADVCSITGGAFNSFYNQSEGTLFADVSGLMTDVLGGNRGFAIITDGTYANAFGILKSANIGFIRAEGNTGNVAQFSLTNAYAPFTQYKVALGVRTNDTNAAFNGSLKTTDTSVTLPSTMNRLEFRDATGAAGGQPSCHLAAIRYYKKRLPNAKLVALTT